MSPLRADRLVLGYYLATPVFAAADLLFDVPIRLATVVPVPGRIVWYLVAFALGLLVAARPGAGPWVGMIESAANLFVLLLSILLPIWSVVETADTTAAAGIGLEGTGLLNAVLSGLALVVSFQRSRAAAFRQRGRSWPSRP